ncbi:VWA domain-containing protein [Fulvimarina sp. MAC8]|uniref:vWA domain-containing protein n=1 Tax=Fulvimarina sp. MAC8 TaxID=3162874 RepID=UPI0032EF3821
MVPHAFSRRNAIFSCFAKAVAFGAVLVWPAVSFSQDAAPDAPRTAIVLDSSGSMWGEIDGHDKIEIARETLREVLGTVPSGHELGLIAYGHRRKGDCSDIEELVPLQRSTTAAAAISSAARSIRPKGKTPLTDALRFAAEKVRFTEERATVVVITDGIETCAADPCAVARDLERDGIDFTAHVVGLGLSEDEGRQVACLAEETGGRYIQAGDANSLNQALTEVVALPSPEPEPEEPEQPAGVVPVGIDLRDTRGGRLLTARDMTVQLLPADGDESLALGKGEADEAGNSVANVHYEPTSGGPPSISAVLTSGRHMLRVTRDYGPQAAPQYKEVVHDVPIEVAGMPDERIEAVLPGGMLQLEGFVHAGEPLPDKDFAYGPYRYTRADWTIHQVADGTVNETPWHEHTLGFPATGMPPGDYVVRGTLGLAQAETRVTIRDQELTDATLDFEAARLRVSILDENGQPISGSPTTDICPDPGVVDDCTTKIGAGPPDDPSRIFMPSGEAFIVTGRSYYDDTRTGFAPVGPLAPGEDILVTVREREGRNVAEAWRREAKVIEGGRQSAPNAEEAAAPSGTEEAEVPDHRATEGGSESDEREEQILALNDTSDEPKDGSPQDSAGAYPRLYRIEVDAVSYGTVSIQPDGPETFTPATGFCSLANSCQPELQVVTGVAITDGTAEGEFTVGEERFRLAVNETTGRAALFPADAFAMLDRKPVSGKLVATDGSEEELKSEDAPKRSERDDTSAGPDAEAVLPVGVWLFGGAGAPTIEACLADHLAVRSDGRAFRGAIGAGVHEVKDGAPICRIDGETLNCGSSEDSAGGEGTLAQDGNGLIVCEPDGDCNRFFPCNDLLETSGDPRAALLLSTVRGENTGGTRP